MARHPPHPIPLVIPRQIPYSILLADAPSVNVRPPPWVREDEYGVANLADGNAPVHVNRGRMAPQHTKEREKMSIVRDEKQLGHIHDFIMRTISEVDVGRSFLYAVAERGAEGKTERERTFELMVCYYVFLCAARLLEKRGDSLGLKDLKNKRYSDLIRDTRIRNRILELVDEVDEVGKPLRDFRNKWVAHVGKIRISLSDFNESAAAVMQITEEINRLLCEARKRPCPTVDEYLDACRQIRVDGRPEQEYSW